MVLVNHGVQGIEVHQLLVGRDIGTSAQDPMKMMVLQFASQMANYVYLIVDRNNGTATAVDPCWDCEGLFRAADELDVRLNRAYVKPSEQSASLRYGALCTQDFHTSTFRSHWWERTATDDGWTPCKA